ncbi:Oxidored-FMN domain-containing protein [Fusarium keratoplasticum]|uniref:Oxidored-FMN domain-containing protein n=1 Tax=Fusarium keratoplasticum TaxID=1328300 RepID=A0ACC0QDE5_9HYPO|nr:Oxidored-FMN domain-containing protein [Fusarium keratoplasticum]KAI8650904.1 Oxidored-FMN domain-containing protein [Fusarium keratoplasticum]
MSATQSNLWKPLKLGNVTLTHRIALAPLTRLRNDEEHLPMDIMTQYYTDRASTPGTLLVSEATGISKAAEAAPHTPGISSPEQVAAWSRIYNAIHSKGCFIFQQLWDMGRAGYPEYVQSRGLKYSSSTNKQLEGRSIPPTPLTEEEIWEKVKDFRSAARNVIDAGGDGVEIHGAHGYLIDQFLSSSINDRTDKWGGSIENRARFLLEIVKAVVEEVGAERTALRLSPFASFQGAYTTNTWEQTSYVIGELKRAGYKLAYLSFVEPRGNPTLTDAIVRLASDIENPFGEKKQSLDFILEEWDNQSPVMVAGGYLPHNIYQVVDEQYKKWGVVVAFGRWFVSNPDLVFRVKNGVPFTPYKRELFYAFKSNEGYNDYTFSDEFVDLAKVETAKA